MVLVSELNPPPGAKPIEWILLTDLPIDTVEDVLRIIDYYTCRWQIEIYFRILKSGCKVEESQLETAERFEPYLALCMIVAWRVMHVMMLGRECPDLPCDVAFDDDEWQAVYATVKKATAAVAAALDENDGRPDCVVGRLAGSQVRRRTRTEGDVGRHATHDGPRSGLACPRRPQCGMRRTTVPARSGVESSGLGVTHRARRFAL